MSSADAVHDRADSWDLFCRVIDNLGDVGIAWRLARQLADEPSRTIRLVVDDLDALARIEPRIDPRLDRQRVHWIGIERWTTAETDTDRSIAATVIEVLGCGLPPSCLRAMVEPATAPPVWIDFEHLSAESWVADFHGRPSPHPVLPLVKHFFYPGFGSDTGGLLLEPGLASRRESFVEKSDEGAALWRSLRLPRPQAGEIRVSMFAYPQAPLERFAALLAEDVERTWSLVVPDVAIAAPSIRVEGSLTTMTIPLVDQDTYDRLLWTCDVNFVRGEDSFVRAQAAARPFVWQIYRQADAAHLKKLEAFEDRYEAGLPVDARRAQRAFWRAWNERPEHLPAAFGDWAAALAALKAHAADWQRRITDDAPLVERLVAFVAERRRVVAT